MELPRRGSPTCPGGRGLTTCRETDCKVEIDGRDSLFPCNVALPLENIFTDDV